MSKSIEMQCKSYPKINAKLSIVGKRSDGYHELESLFLILDEPYDLITLKYIPNKTFKIELTSNADIPLNHDNLCAKAILAYAEFLGNLTGHFQVDIQKQIPIAGGMAGGSSNCATILNGLNTLFEEKIPPKSLHAIATHLGADVPLFLKSKPSKATGIGECLTPLIKTSKSPFGIVIINSFFGVSARWAYTHRIGKFSQINSLEKISEAYLNDDFKTFCEEIKNDLAPAVIEKFPILQNHIKNLYHLGAKKVELSGSGPTLFALFETIEKAQAVATKINHTTQPHIQAIGTGFSV